MRDDAYSADTRKRILDAASEAFSEGGYNGTSIRQIVAKAGTNLASVNYHFGNKDALYEAVLKATFSDLMSELGVALGEIEDDDHNGCRIHAFAKRRILSGIRKKRFRPPRLLGWEIVSPKFGMMNLMERQLSGAEEQLAVLLSPLFADDIPAQRKALAVRWFFTATLPPPPIALSLRHALGDEPDAAALDQPVSHLANAAVAGVMALAASPTQIPAGTWQSDGSKRSPG